MSCDEPASEVAVALDEAHLLGEGVRWWAHARSVVWVDILGQRIRCGRLDDLRLVDVTTTTTPGPVGFVAPTSAGTLIAAVGLELLELDDGALTAVAAIDHPAPGPVRCNDGAVDPVGRVFAGVMGRHAEPGWGALYRFDGTAATKVRSDMTIPNGLGWSPDGATMYVTDSHVGRIDAHPYDPATGELGPAARFVEVARPGVPDGLCVDADGSLWSAIWGAGEVRRYAPDGRLDRVVTVPARQPSACAFCGPAGDVLVITSATEGLDAPSADDGAVFACRPGVTGRAPFEASMPLPLALQNDAD